MTVLHNCVKTGSVKPYNFKERLMATKFTVYFDKAKKYRFNLKATNGQIIATSEAYNTKLAALKGIQSIQKNAAESKIVDETVPAAVPAAKKPGRKPAVKDAVKIAAPKKAAVKKAAAPKAVKAPKEAKAPGAKKAGRPPKAKV